MIIHKNKGEHTMKKSFFAVIVVIMAIFFLSCEKGEQITPTPDPDPIPSVKIEIQADFSSQPDGVEVSINDLCLLRNSSDLYWFKRFEQFVLPLSTTSLTGDTAKQYIGKSIYVAVGFSRGRGGPMTGSLVIKKIESLKAWPEVNKVEIPVYPPEYGYYEIIDP